MFRNGLLDGRRIVFAGGDRAAIVAELRRLGAWVDSVGDRAPLTDEDAAAAWVAERLPLNALVLDAGPDFAAGGEAGLRAALERAWIVARAVATGALIPADGAGRLVLVAPRPEAGVHAQAARAALENLARTLPVEWARFGVTAVAIAPGAQTTDEELAALLCFLLSPAGSYYTGCRFELGVVADSRPVVEWRSFISAS